MKWVTRERPKVDRIACPWLIKRFVDSEAVFLYVPADQVNAVAEKEGAIPYDAPGVELGHHGTLCSFDAILNTTPVGMHPRTKISPLTAEELNCRTVMDLIYRPEQTQLLQLAARQGIATVSGVEMFLAQGIAQWELWTKQRAPEAVMRRAILKALRGENSAAPSRAKSAHGKTNAAKYTKRDAR